MGKILLCFSFLWLLVAIPNLVGYSFLRITNNIDGDVNSNSYCTATFKRGLDCKNKLIEKILMPGYVYTLIGGLIVYPFIFWVPKNFINIAAEALLLGVVAWLCWCSFQYVLRSLKK